MDTHKTFHLWTNQFSIETQKSINKIKNLIIDKISKQNFFSNINHDVQLLDDMDEYYQSAPNNIIGSDRVFVTPHLDGFLGWIPFMKTWRCIYGLNGPHQTITKIPFLTDENIIISNNYFYCFDFNRDLHWVYQNKNNTLVNSRKILKLHFMDYPKWLSFLANYYAKLNIKYNKFARKQFLFSQDPYNNPATFLVATFINLITTIGGSIEKYFGFINLFIILLFIRNNNLTNKLLCLQYSLFFIIISCKINNCTNAQFIRDTSAYTISIIGVLTFNKIKNIKLKFYLPVSYLIIYLSGIFYTIAPKLTKNIYYNELSVFQDYHTNKYNQFIHLVTTSYGVMGFIQILNKYLYISYINLWCFLFLYTRYLIPDPDCENLTVLLFSFYFLLLKKFPYNFKKPIKMIVYSILLQELSHYVFNESTYMSNYVGSKSQNIDFFKHINWLIPFEIRTFMN